MADPQPDPPIQVREATLPGVGKKYVMPLRAGGNLAIVVRPDGARQLYHFLEDDDRPFDVIRVDQEEAQQVAQLLGHALVAPDRGELELVLGALEIDWVTLEPGSPLVGRSLGESQLRTRTGASVMAVMRDGRAIANPPIETVFEADDTLLVIGSPEQADAARELLAP